mmetsp:Transcript_23664/g.40049  ORF Transcript_23664/g.40049 Transcript_23664/m.40049 type:complete len:261 (+) Transcript_23664:484-1266(+)
MRLSSVVSLDALALLMAASRAFACTMLFLGVEGEWAVVGEGTPPSFSSDAFTGGPAASVFAVSALFFRWITMMLPSPKAHSCPVAVRHRSFEPPALSCACAPSCRSSTIMPSSSRCTCIEVSSILSPNSPSLVPSLTVPPTACPAGIFTKVSNARRETVSLPSTCTCRSPPLRSTAKVEVRVSSFATSTTVSPFPSSSTHWEQLGALTPPPLGSPLTTPPSLFLAACQTTFLGSSKVAWPMGGSKNPRPRPLGSTTACAS